MTNNTSQVGRTLRGTKDEMIAFLQEHHDYLTQDRAEHHLTQKQQAEFRNQAKGLAFAIDALRDWEPVT